MYIRSKLVVTPIEINIYLSQKKFAQQIILPIIYNSNCPVHNGLDRAIWPNYFEEVQIPIIIVISESG